MAQAHLDLAAGDGGIAPARRGFIRRDAAASRIMPSWLSVSPPCPTTPMRCAPSCWRRPRHVLAGAVLHADDTPVPVLAPGLGRTRTGRLGPIADHPVNRVAELLPRNLPSDVETAAA